MLGFLYSESALAPYLSLVKSKYMFRRAAFLMMFIYYALKDIDLYLPAFLARCKTFIAVGAGSANPGDSSVFTEHTAF